MGANPLPSVPVQIPQPLGLPKGSVRATLALFLSATMWYMVIKGQQPPTILIESVLLVVAFYFGTRSMAPAAGASAAAPGPSPPPAAPGHEPLYLPRGSVRTVLLFGFFSVIVYVWFRGGTAAIPSSMILILQVLTSYLSGFILSTLTIWRARKGEKPIRAVAWLRHGVAAASLAIVAAVCGTIVLGQPAWMPHIPDNFLAWTVAFYFGSRLSP